jgi:hypothetical protein
MDDISPPSTLPPPSRTGALKGQETPRSNPPSPGQYLSFQEGRVRFDSEECTGEFHLLTSIRQSLISGAGIIAAGSSLRGPSETGSSGSIAVLGHHDHRLRKSADCCEVHLSSPSQNVVKSEMSSRFNIVRPSKPHSDTISDVEQQWTNLKSPPSAPKSLEISGVMGPGIIKVNVDGQEAHSPFHANVAFNSGSTVSR